MAKKKKKEGEEISNFQNLEALEHEFKKGKMPYRKVVALRKKLLDHYKDGSITEDEQDLMESILRKERLTRVIASADNYILNAIESERCESLAIVSSDDIPVVLHLKKDLECRFRFDDMYDDGKNKEDSIGRYFVYVPRTIPTRHQLTISTVQREERGHPVPDSEYPAPKSVVHLVMLKAKEFERWFTVQDEDILNSESKETEEEKAFNF